MGRVKRAERPKIYSCVNRLLHVPVQRIRIAVVDHNASAIEHRCPTVSRTDAHVLLKVTRC